MNTNLLIKYLHGTNEETELPEKHQKQAKENSIMNEKIQEGPITRSRSKLLTNEIESKGLKSNFDHNSAENMEATKLIKFFTLM